MIKGVFLFSFLASSAFASLEVGGVTFRTENAISTCQLGELTYDDGILTIPSGESFFEESYKRNDLKKCSVAIPLTVRQGSKLKISKMSYASSVYVPQNAKGSLTTELFFSDHLNSYKLSQNLYANTNNPYIDINLEGDLVLETGCGLDTNLRLSTTQVLKSSQVMIYRGADVIGHTLKIEVLDC